jgi:hypothetical protein
VRRINHEEETMMMKYIEKKARQAITGKSVEEIRQMIESAVKRLAITELGEWDVYSIPQFEEDWEKVFAESALLPGYLRKSKHLEYGWDTVETQPHRVMIQVKNYGTLAMIQVLLADLDKHGARSAAEAQAQLKPDRKFGLCAFKG